MFTLFLVTMLCGCERTEQKDKVVDVIAKDNGKDNGKVADKVKKRILEKIFKTLKKQHILLLMTDRAALLKNILIF